MALFSLDNGCVSLVVSSLGGSVLKFTAYTPEGELPLLRPAVVSDATPALQSGCFPLVPFGKTTGSAPIPTGIGIICMVTAGCRNGNVLSKATKSFTCAISMRMALIVIR